MPSTKLSKKQQALLRAARSPEALVLNGFDGEYVTARSLAKRGLVRIESFRDTGTKTGVLLHRVYPIGGHNDEG